MNYLYILLALVVFAERSEASFEHGHGFGEFGHVPVVAAAAPLYYSHYPTLHSFHGFGYGGFFPFKNRKAARKHHNANRIH